MCFFRALAPFDREHVGQHGQHVTADVEDLHGVLQGLVDVPQVRCGELVEHVRRDHVVGCRRLGHLDGVHADGLDELQPHPLVVGGDLGVLVRHVGFGEGPEDQ